MDNKPETIIEIIIIIINIIICKDKYIALLNEFKQDESSDDSIDLLNKFFLADANFFELSKANNKGLSLSKSS